MAKRIEIAPPNQVYRRVEELATSADMKPTEVARMPFPFAHPSRTCEWPADLLEFWTTKRFNTGWPDSF